MAIKLQGLETDIKINTKEWSSGVKGAIAVAATLIASIAAIGVGIGKMVQGTFKWAGELDSLQDVMGVTNKQAAALNFVLHKSGTETETFTKGMVILEKGLVKADGSLDTTGKKLGQFGINALDVNGKVKDQASLINDISNKYNSFGTQTERVNFLTELFGKSGGGLIDVFDTLAGEGGLDKTTDKVEKLGLAIDPQKYENFERNLEEIKLAGLGLAVSFVDFLMPAFTAASRWWENTGLPAFLSMRKWLGENVPTAVDTSKKIFDKLGITWNTTIKPAADQLIILWNNLTLAGQKLDPSTDGVAGKFTVLGASIRVVIGFGAVISATLHLITWTLEQLNGALTTAIQLWDIFHRSANQSTSAPNVPSGGTGSRTPGRTGRATGGVVMSGQSTSIAELGKPEIFTPHRSGQVSDNLKVTLTDRDLERIGEASGKYAARAIAPALQRRMAS